MQSETAVTAPPDGAIVGQPGDYSEFAGQDLQEADTAWCVDEQHPVNPASRAYCWKV
jgi:hypothetical protein